MSDIYTIKTRADAKGNWCAKVVGPVDEVMAQLMAKDGICASVRLRESGHSGGFGPDDLQVKLRDSFPVKEGMEYNFVETILDEYEECDQCGAPIDYCQGHGELG